LIIGVVVLRYYSQRLVVSIGGLATWILPVSARHVTETSGRTCGALSVVIPPNALFEISPSHHSVSKIVFFTILDDVQGRSLTWVARILIKMPRDSYL